MAYIMNMSRFGECAIFQRSLVDSDYDSDRSWTFGISCVSKMQYSIYIINSMFSACDIHKVFIKFFHGVLNTDFIKYVL